MRSWKMSDCPDWWGIPTNIKFNILFNLSLWLTLKINKIEKWCWLRHLWFFWRFPLNAAILMRVKMTWSVKKLKNFSYSVRDISLYSESYEKWCTHSIFRSLARFFVREVSRCRNDRFTFYFILGFLSRLVGKFSKLFWFATIFKTNEQIICQIMIK